MIIHEIKLHYLTFLLHNIHFLNPTLPRPDGNDDARHGATSTSSCYRFFPPSFPPGFKLPSSDLHLRRQMRISHDVLLGKHVNLSFVERLACTCIRLNILE